MSLPVSRNRTYAASSQVKSADLNDVQDQIINLWAGKHGQWPMVLHAYDAIYAVPANISHANIGQVGFVTSVASQRAYWGLRLPQDTRIIDVILVYQTNGGTAPTLRLRRISSAGAEASQAGSANNCPSTGGLWSGEDVILNDINHTIVTGYGYFLDFVPGQVNDVLAYAKLVIDLP